MPENFLTCRTALVFTAIVAAATTAQSNPWPQPEISMFAQSWSEPSPNPAKPDNWRGGSTGRSQQASKPTGEAASKPLFWLDLYNDAEMQKLYGTPQRDVPVKIPSAGSTPGLLDSFERFPLGSYYVSPKTDTAIQTLRPLNNSDCPEDSCADTTFRPRARLKSSSAGTPSGLKGARMPYFGLSIGTPLN